MTTGFAGFGPGTFAFLRGLAENQTKPWFEANRAAYLADLQGPSIMLAELVAAEMARRDIPLTGDGKRSVFRIHRDVRFSKDKSPYKTETGIVWRRPGAAKVAAGIAYLHVADGGCFVATGFYGVEKSQVTALRDAIRDDPADFAAARAEAAAAGLTLDTSDSLVRTPRGYEAITDPDSLAAIKVRNLILRRALTKRAVGGAGLVTTVADAAEASLPFLRFGWNALDDAAPTPEWAKLH